MPEIISFTRPSGRPLPFLPLATVFVFFLFSCATVQGGKEPPWVSDPYQVYNRDMYLAAVGFGGSRDLAEKDALAKLTAIFSQSVSGKTEVRYTYSEALEKSKSTSSESSRMAQSIRTAVKMDTLIGAEIMDVWNSGTGTFYAAAAMNKLQASAAYSDLIQQNSLMIAKLTGLSAQDRQSFDAYMRLEQAASFADANAVFFNVMKILNPAYPALGYKSGNDYRLEASEIAKNIPVGITVQNDNRDRIKNAFSRAFSAAGFRTGGNGSRYALNAELRLEEVQYEDKTYRWIRYTIEAALTDTSTGTVLFPYKITDREGHNSIPQAENKALDSAEQVIKNSYVKALEEFLSQNGGK